MKRSGYRDRDYSFGQTMLTLRSGIGLTQTGLADELGGSRRAIGDWEAGISYPKAQHLKHLITLGIKHRAFPAGQEADAIRALWKAANQKILLDETWLTVLLATGAPVADPITQEAPRVAGARRGALNLPFQPTPFIGRDTELADIARILRDPACRLLTLLGPGGIGKTRLATEVAMGQTDAFADGVVFVPLASVGVAHQIVWAIGEALGLSFAGQPDPLGYLLGYLRPRQILLVLDNFEHLLAGAGVVHDLLAGAPSLNILVTSRERLNLQAEWLFDVDGLVYPPRTPHTILPAQVLSQIEDYSALQLFIQRVTQVQPAFALTDTALIAIVGICQHVAGMPLAIELAAAGVRALTVTEIEQQIRSNLDVLATTLRDMPARHQSMRAVVDHSWNMLTPAEKTLFSHLAVFRGGCTAEAAERIAGATLAGLLALMDKSLLRQTTPTGRTNNPVAPRFVLLEPLREYALEKLIAQGESDALHRAHAQYYLALAEALTEQWYAQTLDSVLEQLTRENDNVFAVLDWALNGGDLAIGFNLGAALARFWRNRGYHTEGRVWMANLLALETPSADTALLMARLRATRWAAWLASDQHDFAHAALLLEQSMALRELLGVTEDETETNLLIVAGLQARASGNYDRALVLLEESLSQHRAQDNRETAGNLGIGLSLQVLGGFLRERGNFERAQLIYEECLQLHSDLGDREGMIAALLGLGDIARDQGDAAGLQSYSERCISITRELGMQWAIGFSLNNLAQAAYLKGNLAEAAAHINESVSLFRSIQADASLCEVLITQGNIWRAQGELASARAALTEALRLVQIHGPRLLLATTLEALAGVLAQMGQASLAVRLLSAAAALREQMGAPMRPIDELSVERALNTARLTLGAPVLSVIWADAAQQPLAHILAALPNLAGGD